MTELMGFLIPFALGILVMGIVVGMGIKRKK